MYCIHCGASIPANAAFCPSCGKRVVEPPRGSSETGSKRLNQPIVCTSCGSNSIRRVRHGEYRCEHCGSRFFVEAQAGNGSAEAAEARLTELFAESDRYQEAGEIRKELQLLVKGLEFAPDNCSLMLRLGKAYWRLGFIQNARDYYQKAEELNPDDPIVYVNIGVLYFSQGEYSEARKRYERGIAIFEADPLTATVGEKAMTYGNYGYCLGMLGDTEGAKHYLQKARQMGYSKKSLSVVCERIGLDPEEFDR